MNKYDIARRDKIVKTLTKAKEQTEEAFVYLIAGSSDMEAATDMKLAIEHITIALDRLSAREGDPNEPRPCDKGSTLPNSNR